MNRLHKIHAAVVAIGLCAALFVTAAAVSQQRPAGAAPPTTMTTTQAQSMITEYCVTCHNDKTKRANLTLENLDLSTAGDHAELWERVVRKLRAAC